MTDEADQEPNLNNADNIENNPDIPPIDFMAVAIENKINLCIKHGVKRTNSGVLICACKEGSGCSQPGRHPVEKGFNKQFPAEKKIAAWVKKGGNIGAVCVDGIFVIDIDDVESTPFFYSECEKFGIPTNTLKIQSSPGKYHLYFTSGTGESPKTVAKSKGVFGRKIELIGNGGNLNFPPSVHRSGCNYEFAENIPIITLTAEQINHLQTHLQPPDTRCSTNDPLKNINNFSGKNEPADPAEVERALNYISPDIERDIWWRIGSALKKEMNGAGFTLFDNWSSRAGKPTYEGTNLTRKQWDTFEDKGITIRTLWHHAKLAGYKPPKKERKPFVSRASRAPSAPPVTEHPEDFDGMDGGGYPPDQDYPDYDGAGQDDGNDTGESDFPIKYLGYNGDVYYYYHIFHRRIVEWTPAKHTKLNMFSLMPLEKWLQVFPGFDFDMIASELMAESQAVGLYNPETVRQCGAWIEDKKIIINTGDRIHGTPGQKYLYLQDHTIADSTAEPLDALGAKDFLRLCKCLPVKKESLDAEFLAGWCAIAAVSGAMWWRSHLWVTGGRGSGKTRFLSKIVRRALKENVVMVQSSSTSAGIRQELETRAKPVIFDEAESENRQAAENIQSVLALARQASSADGGKILKGGQTGKSVSYRVQSCFAMASISPALLQAADQSRFTVVEFDQKYQAVSMPDSDAMLEEILTPGFSDRFFMRCVKLIPQIRSNARLFAAIIGDSATRRAGDQVGTLLAGAYSLISEKILTEPEARAYIESIESRLPQDEKADEPEQLRDYILQSKIDFDVQGLKRQFTIGKLIAEKLGHSTELGLDAGKIRLALSEHGMVCENGTLAIANSHRAIKEILKDTSWSHDYSKILKRLAGAEAAGVVRLPDVNGSRNTARAVKIPV